MISYCHPKVQLLLNPVGIDFEIQNLQQRLAEIPWLEVVFGRCSKQSELKQQPGRRPVDIIVPEVLYNKEPYNCMINDNLKSYCFFNASDPLSIPTFDPGDLELVVSQPVDIILWLNLKKVNPLKTYNYSEELRLEVIKKLSGSNFKMSESFIEADEVFKPFTITDNFRNYSKFPYAAFKISGELTFDYFKKC